MALVLPNAPPVPAQPAANPKGTLHPVSKAAPNRAHHPGEPAPKSKFHTLLEKMGPKAHPVPKAPAHPEPPKAPVPKAKAAEVHPEKTKDPKKAPVREAPKNDRLETALVAGVLVPVHPKVEPPKAPKAEGADQVGAAEKHKALVKTEKKPGTDPAHAKTPAPLSQAARSQGTGAPKRGEKTDEKPKVFVVDRRTETKEKDKLRHPGAEAAGPQPVTSSTEAQGQPKTADPKASDLPISYQTVAGKTPDGFDLKPQNTPVSPRDAATFQQYLVEKGYGQLVDQARIILKDHNAGEIRMTLHPESLGKVKVSLNLNDNSLAGQIYVENQTVKDVFQANMDNLLQSFRDGGFSDLSLQVSVGNGNAGGNAGQDQPRAAAQARDYGRQVAETVAADPRADRIGSWNDRQINLTA